MPGVITNSESPTAADHDRITATRETLEDYTLRLAPRSYRRWPPAVVGISALGGIAYLADFAIGANVGITWGTANARDQRHERVFGLAGVDQFIHTAHQALSRAGRVSWG